jgi:hypothetical protein
MSVAAPAAPAATTATTECSGTNSDLICKKDKEYIINDSNSNIKKIKGDYIDKITIEGNEISLTPSSSNHYFYADEKAHCSETWQDWFCIPNYHNNNKVNKYPFTKTMSVGVCYDYCARGSNGKYMTIKNKTKCEVYDDENDLIYNPLAIIAMLGTHFNKEADTNLQELTTLKYIGLRGSYFNDLYRVNKNDNFITVTIINLIKNTDKKAVSSVDLPSYQDKLLANIIKGLHNDKETNTTILRIKKDVNDAIKTIKGFYIDNKNTEQKEIFFNKIKDYVFDIDKLENVYGKDKNGKNKIINIIAYAYNIMYLLYNADGVVRKQEEITKRLNILIGYHSADMTDNDKSDLIKMFQYACYNCFNVNFDNFKTYIDNNPYDNIRLRIDINKEGNTHTLISLDTKAANGTFKKLVIDIEELAKGTAKTTTYDLSYYIKYYDHSIFAEYGGQEKNLLNILIMFAVFCVGLLSIVLFYLFLVWGDLHNPMISFFNFSFLFYKLGTFGILRNSCIIYYYLLSRLSKYTILSILFKIFNIVFIIFLLGYLYKIITELISIDYITLLKGTEYDKLSELSPENRALYTDIALYIFITYLIYIYIYSVYIIRYSLSESKFDIMTNIDADDKTALEFVENVLVSNYTSELVDIFTGLKPDNPPPSS